MLWFFCRNLKFVMRLHVFLVTLHLKTLFEFTSLRLEISFHLLFDFSVVGKIRVWLVDRVTVVHQRGGVGLLGWCA